jgi:hypothetical protein
MSNPEHLSIDQQKIKLNDRIENQRRRLAALISLRNGRAQRLAAIQQRHELELNCDRLLDHLDVKISSRLATPPVTTSPLFCYLKELTAKIQTERSINRELENHRTDVVFFPDGNETLEVHWKSRNGRLHRELTRVKRFDRRLCRKCEQQAATIRRLANDIKISKAKLHELTRAQQLASIRHNENISLLYEFMTTVPDLVKSDIAKLETTIQEKQQRIRATRERIIQRLDTIDVIAREYGIIDASRVMIVPSPVCI